MVRGAAFLLSHMFMYKHYLVGEENREFSCFPPSPSLSHQSFLVTLPLSRAEEMKKKKCSPEISFLLN